MWVGVVKEEEEEEERKHGCFLFLASSLFLPCDVIMIS